MMNSVSIGVQTDVVARNRSRDEPPFLLRAIELCFCAVFTVELTVRFLADHRRWFSMLGWQWNVFDSLVVLLQLAEESLNVFVIAIDSDTDDGTLPNLSFLRVLRILRLVRIIRLVRILRLIGELRTLIMSIGGSLKSLGWTVVLLFMIIYAISIYLTQLVRDTELDQDLDMLYGSVSSSMLALFQSVTGGLDWQTAVLPLSNNISPVLSVAFCAYIAFTVLAVMNVVTGVFVENALISAKRDQEIYMVSNMRELFIQANGSEDGSMSWLAFEEQQKTVQMMDFFKSIDVDVSEARGIFRLLDLDNSGGIDMEEFISGCIRLRGDAKALDMAVLIYEIRRIAESFTVHAARVEHALFFSHMQNLPQAAEQDDDLEESEDDKDEEKGVEGVISLRRSQQESRKSDQEIAFRPHRPSRSEEEEAEKCSPTSVEKDWAESKPEPKKVVTKRNTLVGIGDTPVAPAKTKHLLGFQESAPLDFTVPSAPSPSSSFTPLDDSAFARSARRSSTAPVRRASTASAMATAAAEHRPIQKQKTAGSKALTTVKSMREDDTDEEDID